MFLMDELLLLLMNNWNVFLMDLVFMDHWLNVLMKNVLMMLMKDVLMRFFHHIFMMLYHDIFAILSNQWSLKMFSNFGTLLMC
jgi:hypothetical protein